MGTQSMKGYIWKSYTRMPYRRIISKVSLFNSNSTRSSLRNLLQIFSYFYYTELLFFFSSFIRLSFSFFLNISIWNFKKVDYLSIFRIWRSNSGLGNEWFGNSLNEWILKGSFMLELCYFVGQILYWVMNGSITLWTNEY